MPERPPPTSGRAVHRGVVKLGVCHPDILERYAFPALADLYVGDPGSIAGARYPAETMSLVHSMLVASGSALTTLRLFGVVLDEYFLSTMRHEAGLEFLELGIFSWSTLPTQDIILQTFFHELSEENSSQADSFQLLPALRSLRIKISLNHADNGPHRDSSVPIRHFGFADATLAEALKVRCRQRSLDFALVVMARTEHTWDLDMHDLSESGLCAAVQRKGEVDPWEPVYSEGARFLDDLSDGSNSSGCAECSCHWKHPRELDKECADCARRKEDDEFWRAGVIS
ncbi:hypothetical protein BDZ89DRAFT_1078631 [Hymenopellis radicata]|nr:hypothetical protein BDZ89DRAFT_1078631 [Hymenopellis radicata]